MVRLVRVSFVDVKSEARDFLSSRRAKVTPDQVGLPAWGANRRVSGLRREEVALLAGVSLEYYVRMERGNLAGVSDAVLDAVASALLLDDAERAHLFDLARAANSHQPSRPAKQAIRPQAQWLLDSMTDSAAYIRNARTDILATNALGKALYAPILQLPGRPNIARFLFLDPQAPDFFVEYEKVAAESAAMLRTLAGENPYDKGLTQLVGELSTRSEHFASLWATHNVRQHFTGVKRFRHPIVGELALSYESMTPTADPSLRLNAYFAEPGSDSAQRFGLLASWAHSPATLTEGASQ